MSMLEDSKGERGSEKCHNYKNKKAKQVHLKTWYIIKEKLKG